MRVLCDQNPSQIASERSLKAEWLLRSYGGGTQDVGTSRKFAKDAEATHCRQKVFNMLKIYAERSPWIVVAVAPKKEIGRKLDVQGTQRTFHDRHGRNSLQHPPSLCLLSALCVQSREFIITTILPPCSDHGNLCATMTIVLPFFCIHSAFFEHP